MLRIVERRQADEEFLYRLYASTRAEETAAWGWTEPQRDLFLRQQYESQRRSYASRYPNAVDRIVVSDEEPVGRILTADEPEAVVLIDLALLPEYRGRGIGTQLIRDLQRTARERGKPAILHVLEGNPARRLYERLGFRRTEERVPYISMQWDPD